MIVVTRLAGRFARVFSLVQLSSGRVRPVPVVVRAGHKAPPLYTGLLLLLLALAAPASAGTLRGVVVDPSERPLEGAEVRAIGPLGTRIATTDAEGRFELTDLPAAAYQVVAIAAALESSARRVPLAADAVIDLTIALSLRAAPESVVVSASHVEVPLSAAPASVTVVDREELDSRQIDSLGRALSLAPGMVVTRNGGGGSLTSLFPRGGESDYTLVLVDGVRLNTFGGGVDLSQLALGAAERIEIVRGPQSALYGADAIGGVVHVVGRAYARPGVEGLAEGGSRDTTRYALSGGGSGRGWSWSGSAERQASDGDTRTAPATGERVTNDDWLMRQATASVGWQHASAARVRATVRALESERGAPGPYGSNPIDVFEEVDTFARGRNDQAQIGLSAEHPWAGPLASRARQRWTLSWADLDSDFRSLFAGFVSESALQTRRFNVRSQTDLVLSQASSLSAGLEVQLERARNTFVTGERGQEVPIDRRVAGYFAELRQDLGASMALTAGVRMEDIRRTKLEGDPFAFTPRPVLDNDRRQSVNPRVTWTWVAGEEGSGAGQTRVHVSAGTGIRPPDVFEIAFTDNSSLKPERSRSVEAGVAHRLGRTPFTLQVTSFRNTYDDLIVTVGQSLRGSSRYRSDNISNARAQGLELGADWRSSGFTARAAYTWLDAEILEVDGGTDAPPPFEPGDRLIRRPRHSASALLQYGRGRASAFVEAAARGRTLDVEPTLGAFGGLFENTGFATLDAGVSVRLTPHVELFGRGLNLLDKRYEEALGYPAPERRGMIGVRVALRQ